MPWSLSQLHCKLRFKALHSCSDLPPRVRLVLQNAVWFLPGSSCALLEDMAEGGWPWSSYPCRCRAFRSCKHMSIDCAACACIIACAHMYHCLDPHVSLLVPTCITACTHMYHCLYPHVLLLVSPCSPCQQCIPILELCTVMPSIAQCCRVNCLFEICLKHHDHPHIWTPSAFHADMYIAANYVIAQQRSFA